MIVDDRHERVDGLRKLAQKGSVLRQGGAFQTGESCDWGNSSLFLNGFYGNDSTKHTAK